MVEIIIYINYVVSMRFGETKEVQTLDMFLSRYHERGQFLAKSKLEPIG